MNHAQDITYWNLGLGFLLMIIPIILFSYYKTGLTKPAIIAVIRMFIQLTLVGIYLQYIFNLNDAWLNVAWVLVMIIVAAFSTVRRSGLNRKLFILPVMFAIFISIAFIDFYFLGVVLRLDYLFDARYFIPMTGMLMGNCLSINIIGLRTFFQSLERNSVQYKFALANGATPHEAIKEFMAEALRQALSPTIATTSVVGIISLPGMMTGQILGGSNPNVAIRYQIMIMLTILVSSLITVTLTLWITRIYVFDSMNILRKDAKAK